MTLEGLSVLKISGTFATSPSVTSIVKLGYHGRGITKDHLWAMVPGNVVERSPRTG